MSDKISRIAAGIHQEYPQRTAEECTAVARELVKLMDRGGAERWRFQGLELIARHRREAPLGTQLRELRRAAGLTQEQVGAKTRWNPTKLSRIETGDVGITWNDMKLLLRLYKVTDRQLAKHLLSQVGRRKRQWAPDQP